MKSWCHLKPFYTPLSLHHFWLTTLAWGFITASLLPLKKKINRCFLHLLPYPLSLDFLILGSAGIQAELQLFHQCFVRDNWLLTGQIWVKDFKYSLIRRITKDRNSSCTPRGWGWGWGGALDPSISSSKGRGPNGWSMATCPLFFK